jgi:phosphate uptake regulator
MRRKIIKQGAGGATIFLPIDWVRKNNLEPGADVEVEDKEGRLLISAEKGKEKKDIEIDITGFPARTVKYVITQAYCSGYTDVRLIFKTKTTSETRSRYKRIHTSSKVKEEYRTIDLIYETVRDLIGYEIVEHKESSARIRQISKVDEEEFRVTLRRMYLLLKELIGTISIEVGKGKLDSDELNQKIDTLHRFANYAVRLLKSQVVSKNNIDLYHIVMRLDYITSSYRYIVRFLTETRNKPSQNTRKMMEGLGNLLQICQDCQYNFSYESYNDFDLQLSSLYYLNNSTYKSETKPDVRLRQIISQCYMELTSVMKSILAMNLKN